MHKPKFHLDWLNLYPASPRKPRFERVETFLGLLDNPHLKRPIIHIGGTNGKGSTLAFLRSFLREAGYRVGAFSTPYMTQYEDQISINGLPIDSEILFSYFEKYKKIFLQASPGSPIHGMLEFEILTILAFDYFAQEKVDFAIIEVGLGGLLDSTNVCRPILTGITTIGLDHVDILGHSLEEIALEKAGIIKKDTPLVTGRISQPALGPIIQRAWEKSAPHYRMGSSYDLLYQGNQGEAEVFSYMSNLEGESSPSEFLNIASPLLGQHQADNAAMAICLFEALARQRKIPYDRGLIERGLARTSWPARMEIVSRAPLIVLDGAHNPHAIGRLAENIDQLYRDKEVHILFAAIGTKDMPQMLDLLSKTRKKSLKITNFDHPQAIKDEDLKAMGYDYCPDWSKYIDSYISKGQPGDLLLIAGSLYFASQVRPYILEKVQAFK